MRIIRPTSFDDEKGPLYIFGKRLTIRIGLERHPLFSERNQGNGTIPIRWRYLFGKRISWRWI